MLENESSALKSREKYGRIYETVRVDALRELVEEKTPVSLTYHTAEHPKDVDQTVERLARKAQEKGKLTERQVWLLKIAALLHDRGLLYELSTKRGHEALGARLAVRYLTENKLMDADDREDAKDLAEIVVAIRDTKMHPHPALPTAWQQPISLLGRYLCDADVANFGQPRFFGLNERHRVEEIGHYAMESYTPKENLERAHLLLSVHKWHTAEADELFAEQKAKNIEEIRCKLSFFRKGKKTG